jgi:glycosyltransferase involved in cell wall biosynthesis
VTSKKKDPFDFVMRRRARRLLHRMVRAVPTSLYRSRPFGVNVIGHPTAPHSIGVTTRLICAALASADVPFDVISVDELSYRRGRSFINHATGARLRPRYAFTLVLAWPTHIDLRVISPWAFAGRYVIGDWLCEQTELPEGFTKGCELVDEIWTGSSFATEVFAQSTTKPVTAIPWIVNRSTNPERPATLDREQLGIPEDRSVFLTIANARVPMIRKNPDGTLHAYRNAFPHGQQKATLIIKSLVEGEMDAEVLTFLNTLRDDPAFGPDVLLLTDALNDDETTDLLELCDCFVSLHRAEGFGMGAAEAMQLGKPVIVTNWSGPADYLTHSNSFPVPAELLTIDELGSSGFLPGLMWAEPDLNAAADFMRVVHEHPELAQERGALAAADISQHHSPEVVGRLMSARLRELHGR